MNSLTRANLKDIMSAAGYCTSFEDDDGDAGDLVQPEAPNGTWMNQMNLVAAFQLMQWALKLPANSVQIVHPELLKTFMRVHLQGFDEGATAEELEVLQECQKTRRNSLRNALMAKAVVFVPVHHKDHWALLVVDGRNEANRKWTWRDSLTPGDTTKAVKCYIEAALKELVALEGLDDACNVALQPVESAVCGCYVLHWMEQSCRKMILNEPGCSIGWPKSETWAARVHKLVEMMQKEQSKLKKESEQMKLKAFADAAKKKASEAAANVALKKADALVALKADAAAMCSKVPAGKPCLENLSPEAQTAVQKAALGGGVCSKCHWQSGCLACCKEKALQYYLKKEGFIVEVMKYSAPK